MRQGRTTDPVTTWAAPTTYLLVAVAGMGWARRLKHTRPAVYAAIGHGDHPHDDAPTSPPPPAIPRTRDHGDAVRDAGGDRYRLDRLPR